MPEPWEQTWQDYYRVLGIDQTASEAKVTAAFRALARQLHPDALIGRPEHERTEAEARFKIVGEAYEVLRDPERRARYDDAHGHGGLVVLTIDPAAVRVSMFADAFVVRSEIELPPGSDAGGALEVDCDDVDTELTSVAARPHAHGRRVSVTVEARSYGPRTHDMRFTYRMAGAEAVQQISVRRRMPRIPLPRRTASTKRELPALLALCGFAGLVAAITLSLFAATQSAVTIVAPLAIALLVAGATAGAFSFVRGRGWRGRRWFAVRGQMRFYPFVLIAIFGVQILRSFF